VSGLGLGAASANDLSRQLFVDYVTGNAGNEATQEETSDIVRVIVAGAR